MVPYGVYDISADAGWVSVGTDHDTAAFAVESIRRWWRAAGHGDYPQARRLLINADAGGSNGYRTLCHPALAGVPAQEWDTLIATLMTLHIQQREATLDKRRGHRPRLAAPGTGRRPVLTLADRLLATALCQHLALPQIAVAALFSVRPETINRRIRQIRELLEQAGHVIQPGPHRLASLDDLYCLATAEGIVIPSQINTAC